MSGAAGISGWLEKKGKDLLQGWKRRWCVVENGLLQFFESFDSPTDKALGLVPLHGATLGEPKTARSRRSSLGGSAVGPAWRLDTKPSDSAVHAKYILAADDEASSRAWRMCMQAHIEFANHRAAGAGGDGQRAGGGWVVEQGQTPSGRWPPLDE